MESAALRHVEHVFEAVDTYWQCGDMSFSSMYEMIRPFVLHSVDLNHTSRAKQFQKLLFESFHCEALWLCLNGSEKRFKAKTVP